MACFLTLVQDCGTTRIYVQRCKDMVEPFTLKSLFALANGFGSGGNSCVGELSMPLESTDLHLRSWEFTDTTSSSSGLSRRSVCSSGKKLICCAEITTLLLQWIPKLETWTRVRTIRHFHQKLKTLKYDNVRGIKFPYVNSLHILFPFYGSLGYRSLGSCQKFPSTVRFIFAEWYNP